MDLFVPGTGIPDDGDPSVQLHDINGGIPPSGLFWTVQIPDDAFHMSGDSQRAVLRLNDLCLIDQFVFLGPNDTPAVIDAVVRWEATGPAEERGSGDDAQPTEPDAFEGVFRFARAEGRFSGTQLGFKFRAEGSSEPGAFAELGFEENGVFI